MQSRRRHFDAHSDCISGGFERAEAHREDRLVDVSSPLDLEHNSLDLKKGASYAILMGSSMNMHFLHPQVVIAWIKKLSIESHTPQGWFSLSVIPHLAFACSSGGLGLVFHVWVG